MPTDYDRMELVGVASTVRVSPREKRVADELVGRSPALRVSALPNSPSPREWPSSLLDGRLRLRRRPTGFARSFLVAPFASTQSGAVKRRAAFIRRCASIPTLRAVSACNYFLNLSKMQF